MTELQLNEVFELRRLAEGNDFKKRLKKFNINFSGQRLSDVNAGDFQCLKELSQIEILDLSSNCIGESVCEVLFRVSMVVV